MQRQKKRHAKTILTGSLAVLVLLAGAAFTGCSDSTKPPEAKVSTPVSPKQQVVSIGTDTKTEVSAPVESFYDPEGKRDPFEPLIGKDERKSPSKDRPPLERYAINEFKLTGIVWGGFGYNAMFEGPDGKGYFIHEGTIMGPNRGVVKKITRETVVIEEKYKSVSGESSRKEVVIELRRKQEGVQ